MNRELMIFRHAKSSWKDQTLSDYDRPLKGRGRRDAVKMGAYIKDNGWAPDYVLSSTARRAAQTIKRMMAAMDLDKDDVHWERELYLAESDIWIHHLQTVPVDTNRALIVGHNPGLEDLVLELCDHCVAIPEDGKLIPTATLARLSVITTWAELSPRTCKLISIQRPRLLKT